ncbi:hypothetical protein PIB30_052177 [Stylosanthes scabra]|uniref:Uncharacterized protein n=1 Tax=Stylosanthes scabra TaxID=79078 RepID=A0ABU6THY3_9FABA|nr:hypothetical protein [Stylosanthes scabra]
MEMVPTPCVVEECTPAKGNGTDAVLYQSRAVDRRSWRRSVVEDLFLLADPALKGRVDRSATKMFPAPLLVEDDEQQDEDAATEAPAASFPISLLGVVSLCTLNLSLFLLRSQPPVTAMVPDPWFAEGHLVDTEIGTGAAP